MVAYRTGSNHIESGDLGLKVKVTVTENVSKNDEKIHKKFNSAYSWIVYIYLDTPCYHRQFDTKYAYVHITQEKKLKNEIIKFGKMIHLKKE